MKDYSDGHRLNKGQQTTIRASLILFLLLTTVTVATGITTTTQTAQSAPQENTNPSSPRIEGAPTTATNWANTYGGSDIDEPCSIQQTADGGYIVGGYTYSFGAGGSDVWVLKLNSTGRITWQKTYGGSGDDKAYSVQQTSDGDYIVSCYTNSFGAGTGDFWVLKISSSGSVDWQKTLGGSNYDGAYSVQQTSDGGYKVTGDTESFGAGSYDAWIIRLGVDGDIVWNAGSGASTQTTSVSPSDSSATTSVTSVTPANSAATVQDTHVTPLDSKATLKVQSGGTEQGILVIIIVGAVAVVAIVLVILIAIIVKRTK